MACRLQRKRPTSDRRKKRPTRPKWPQTQVSRCDYEIATEPDEVFLDSVLFLAGYRRKLLFDGEVLAEIRDVAKRETQQSISALVEAVNGPKPTAVAELCRSKQPKLKL